MILSNQERVLLYAMSLNWITFHTHMKSIVNINLKKKEKKEQKKAQLAFPHPGVFLLCLWSKHSRQHGQDRGQHSLLLLHNDWWIIWLAKLLANEVIKQTPSLFSSIRSLHLRKKEREPTNPTNLIQVREFLFSPINTWWSRSYGLSWSPHT